jgi:hypothetical protein
LAALESASVELTTISPFRLDQSDFETKSPRSRNLLIGPSIVSRATEFREERDSPMRRVSGVTPADLPHHYNRRSIATACRQQRRKPPMTAPTREQIIHRAYELWERAGKPDGRDEEFYHQAEIELNVGVPGEEKSETFLE